MRKVESEVFRFGIQIIQDALLWRTQMIPLRRIQQAAARNGTQKAAVLIFDFAGFGRRDLVGSADSGKGREFPLKSA